MSKDEDFFAKLDRELARPDTSTQPPDQFDLDLQAPPEPAPLLPPSPKRRKPSRLRRFLRSLRVHTKLAWRKITNWSTAWVVRQQCLGRVYARSLNPMRGWRRFRTNRQIRAQAKAAGKKQSTRGQTLKKKPARPRTPPPTVPTAAPMPQAVWKVKTGHVVSGVTLGVVLVGLTLYAFWPMSGLVLYLVFLAGACFLAYKQAGGKALGWTVAGGLILLLMIVSYDHFRNGSGENQQAANASAPQATAVSVTVMPGSTTFKVVATKEWSKEIALPIGLHVEWMPESPATYEMMTADEKVVTFPAVTQAPIAVPSPLYPWFKFRAVDADSVVIRVAANVPR